MSTVAPPITHLSDALAYAADHPDASWHTLSSRLPRLDLVHLLQEVIYNLQKADQRVAILDAWTSTDYPEYALDSSIWWEWFSDMGFLTDDPSMTQPTSLTLYRGGMLPDRMSWTTDLNVAQLFQRRHGDGAKIWTTTAPADAILAYVGARTEHEWIIDPDWLWGQAVITEARE